MPGLLRGLARTAAVAGTATAVGGRVRRRQDAKFAAKNAQTDVARDEAAQATAPPRRRRGGAAAPPATRRRPLERLKTLGELKAPGVLTEAEFEAQKAKILAG